MFFTIVGMCSWFVLDDSAAINTDPNSKFYIACRWEYRRIAKSMGIPQRNVKRYLKEATCYAVNIRTGKRVRCVIADFGPNKATRRAVDMSLDLFRELGLATNETVRVEVQIHK